MLKLLITSLLFKDNWDGETYSFEDIANNDYSEIALWDVTDERYPKLLSFGEVKTTYPAILSFIEGVRYCVDVDLKSGVLIYENYWQLNLTTDILMSVTQADLNLSFYL